MLTSKKNYSRKCLFLYRLIKGQKIHPSQALKIQILFLHKGRTFSRRWVGRNSSYLYCLRINRRTFSQCDAGADIGSPKAISRCSNCNVVGGSSMEGISFWTDSSSSLKIYRFCYGDNQCSYIKQYRTQ